MRLSAIRVVYLLVRMAVYAYVAHPNTYRHSVTICQSRLVRQPLIAYAMDAIIPRAQSYRIPMIILSQIPRARLMDILLIRAWIAD